MNAAQSPPRKRSPRAPSIALDEAIDRARRIYDKQQLHSGNVDVVARHLGYKDANNGAALTVLASLGYFGLIERPKDKEVSVSRDYQSFRFAPSESVKRELMIKWLRTPRIFADLLDKFSSALPDDANLRFELINLGFLPSTVDVAVATFRRSVETARYFESQVLPPPAPFEDNQSAAPEAGETALSRQQRPPAPEEAAESPQGAVDRIPVRLAKGRRAWLEIPSPFFEADRKRLTDQINLLLTDDEE